MSILKSEINYDPVNAHVPGTDPEAVAEERKALLTAGDPLPPKPKVPEKKLIFKMPGFEIYK